jgi:hypothetical protein
VTALTDAVRRLRQRARAAPALTERQLFHAYGVAYKSPYELHLRGVTVTSQPPRRLEE